MERIGKKPIVMNQFVQRFIVNRLQHAIVISAIEIVSNGWASPEQVDLAVKSSIGIRMPIIGVIQSLDFTGLGLVHDINKSLGLKIPLIEERRRQRSLRRQHLEGDLMITAGGQKRKSSASGTFSSCR